MINININRRSATRAAALVLIALIAVQTLAGCGSGNDGKDFSLPTRQIPEDASEQKFGSFGYLVYDDGTIIITSYDGRESNLTVPSVIDGKTVVAIGDEVFLFNTVIQSVTLPDGLESVGEYAFFGAELLHSVSFGKRLWWIGTAAFEETPFFLSRTEDFVVVGDGVLIMYNGSDGSVTIPENVKHISSAFKQNGTLVSVRMGESVLTVGNLAFAYCEALKYVVFGANTRLIGDYAFESCINLASADIPDKVEKIGELAFGNCNFLMDVRLGSSVRELGAGAFSGDLRIRSVTLPLSLEIVGSGAFYDCVSVGAVFYEGSEEQFEALGLDETNYSLRDMLKIYGVTKK